MEEINSKKTEAFLTAIKTLADEECKSIDEETDRLRVERLRALQKRPRIVISHIPNTKPLV